MPISGSAPSKIFSRSVATFTGSDAFQQLDASGRFVLSVDQDEAGNDIASALNSMVMLDGGNINADIPLNSNKFTGVEDASARTHFSSAGQVQDSALVYAGTSAGTDTITATLSPAPSAYATGMRVFLKAGGTNTGAATLNLNSLGAKDIKKGAAGSTALGAGDITSGGIYEFVYDGTNMQLVNPGLARNVSAFMATVLDDADASTARSTLGLGSIATQAASGVAITGGSIAGITDLAVADGGTGASTAAAARTNLGAVLTDAVFPGALVAIIEDQKSSGTAGGTFTSGADRTRTLNTLVYNRNTTVSLSSNQFTLPAGNWEIEWSAPAYQPDGHQSLLRDVTGAADLARGTTEFADQASEDPALTRSVGSFRVSPSGSNTYEIRHRCSLTQTNDGFGIAAAFGTEVYTRVIIRAA